MMGVQALFFLFRGTAATAAKAVALIDFLAEWLPVPRLIKALAVWRGSAFPCRILDASLTTDMSSASVSNRNVETPSKTMNDAYAYSTFLSDVAQGPIMDYVCIVQPLSLFVRLFFSVVPRHICAPRIAALVPSRRQLAAAFADWRIACRQILGGLAAFAMRVGFLPIAWGHAMFAQNVVNTRFGYSEHQCNRLGAYPCTIGLRCRIKTHDFITLPPCQFRIVVGIAAFSFAGRVACLPTILVASFRPKSEKCGATL